MTPNTALRRTRDRYVTFAFTAADSLFEIDDGGWINDPVGPAFDGSTASHISQLFSPRCDPPPAEKLLSMTAGRRLGPLEVILGNDRPALLFAMRLDDTGVYCALRVLPKPARNGMLSTEDFIETAETQNANFVAMAAMSGLDDLRRRAPEAEDRTMQAIAGYARDHGLAVGRVDDTKLAFSGSETIDTAEIERALAALARTIDPSGRGLTFSVAGKSSLTTFRLLRAALTEFVETGRVDSDQGLRDLSADVQSRMQAANAFAQVLHDAQYSFVFQPIVELLTDKTHHYETNIRFTEGESPYRLITFAEENGLIPELDFAAVDYVLQLLASPKTPKSLMLAVNVSGASLANDMFISRLQSLVSKHRATATRLLIEITESFRMTGIPEIAAKLKPVRKLGVPICLDDFGAGASSFEYLRGFRPDHVKIDGRYIQSADRSDMDRAMLRAIVAMCHDLRIHTVLEMIETVDQQSLALRYGITFGQGYLLGRPHASPGAASRAIA